MGNGKRLQLRRGRVRGGAGRAGAVGNPWCSWGEDLSCLPDFGTSPPQGCAQRGPAVRLHWPVLLQPLPLGTIWLSSQPVVHNWDFEPRKVRGRAWSEGCRPGDWVGAWCGRGVAERWGWDVAAGGGSGTQTGAGPRGGAEWGGAREPAVLRGGAECRGGTFRPSGPGVLQHALPGADDVEASTRPRRSILCCSTMWRSW